MNNSFAQVGLSALFAFLIFAGARSQDPVEPQIGRVEAEEARLFAMQAETQDATLPQRLAREALVVVQARGSSFEGTGTHFYQVCLPGGVQGFVHSKLLRKEEEGWGVISGSNVYLRPTASSQKIPITTLTQGTRLRLLGQEGDWWKVLASEETSVWMRAQDLKIVGPLGAHGAAVAEARQATLSGWKAQLEEAARQASRLEQRALAQKGLAEVNRLMQEQVGPDHLEIDLTESKKALAAFKEAWPAEVLSDLGLTEETRSLEQAIENLQLVHDVAKAKAAVDKTLETYDKPDPNPRPAPRVEWWKEGFVGHLERLKEPHYEARFALVKGGQVLAHLRCTSGRYALLDFQNYSVLVRGDVSTPPSLEGGKLVDVRRLEVLATPF